MLSMLSLWLYSALWSFCATVPVQAVPPEIPASVADSLACVPPNTKIPQAPPLLPCLSGIINQYTPVIGFGCDSSTLQVGTLTGFSAGDKVLLIQMQVPQVDLSNTASFGTALNTTCIGNYEFNRVLSTGGNTVQLQFALTRPYDLSGKLQLVKVPEYDSAMVCGITCLPWNGTVGGVLALDVKHQLTLSGNLDVSGKGFRGGQVEMNNIPWVFGEQQYFYPPQSTLAAQKGEGMVFIPSDFSFGRGRAGNAGGGGNAHNGGGGGGANAGSGGDGGLEITIPPAAPTPNTSGIGGQKYFDNQTNRVLLGGGAGAGHANDELGSSGGSGGGIVFLSAETLQTNNFRILANGVNVAGGQEFNDGQGGGGAGGTVVLDLGLVNGILNCELRGGTGGSNPYTPANQVHGPGGGGGGGKLLLVQNSPNIAPSLQGGINGFSSLNYTNGAGPGEPGKMLVGFSLPEGTQPAHPVSSSMVLAVQSPPCSGFPDGQISVLQSTALAFRLNGGPWQSDSIFTHLAPGVYQVGLQFSGGCVLDTTAVLLAAPPVLDSLLSITNAGCSGGGSIAVAAVSGMGPFEFQLDGGAWQSSGVFSNLLAGNYAITLRDAAGCTHTSPYTVAGAPPVQDSLLALVNASCTAGGTISVTAIAGTGPFEFQLNGGTWQPSGVFTDLPPASYSITLRDATGCVHTNQYTVAPPPIPQDTLLSLTGASCVEGGEISVSALAGTAPFEFQLNGGAWQSTGLFSDLAAGNYSITLRDGAGCTHSGNYTVAAPLPVQDTLLTLLPSTCLDGGALSVAALTGSSPFEFQLDGGPWQSSGDFIDLAAGNHSLTLRDAAGCTHISAYSIPAPPPLQDSLLALSNATCVQGGSLSVGAVSGTAPFEYQLNGGPWQSGGLFSNLPVNNYTLTVRDAAGCTASNNYSIAAPAPVLDSLLSIQQAGCVAGGGIAVTAISGLSPFEFQLNGAGWQSSGIFQDLAAGNYTIAVRDAAGCVHSSNYAVAAAPPALDSLLLLTDATCVLGGQISVAAISGTAPFEFQLNGGAWQANGVFSDLTPANYTLTVRDAAGCTHTAQYSVQSSPPALDSLLSLSDATCVQGGSLSVLAVSGTAPFQFQLDGSAWQSSGVFSNLTAGDHILMLRDQAGCVHSSLYTVLGPMVPQDSLLSVQVATCIAGGAIAVAAISGAAPYEFKLNGGSWQSSGTFSNLPEGDFTLYLRDAAGCVDSSVYSVPGSPLPSDSLLSIVHATCVSGGEIQLIAVSGTAPVEFQLNGAIWQATGTFSGLAPGNYSVQLRDAAGCTHLSQYSILPPTPVLDTLFYFKDANCQSGGEIAVGALAGAAPFEFQLNGGAWQAGGLFSNLPAGVYSIVVRDAAGCTRSSSVPIGEEAPLLLQLDSLGPVDCRHPLGFVAVSASGGLGDYSFQLNPGAQTQPAGYFPGLESGLYAVAVTDSTGCKAVLNGLKVADLIDSAFTQETFTIYEGSYFQLPDGTQTGHAGQYPFHYQTVEGCDSLYLLDLIVLKRNIYVPNIFQPNDDGSNNFFTVYADESLDRVSRLSVFDRWGEWIFEKENLLPNDEENGWDGNFRGRPVNPGVFIWVAKLKFKDGLELTISGNVTLVR